MKIKNLLSTISLVFILAACAVNPVTGKNELALISESQELSIGQKQYAPSRQSQGGDYVADPQVGAYVKEVGERIAKVSDRDLPYEFAVINSSVPNAWALPGGKIAINRGLLVELKNEAELAAVLGHEIVHSAARHSARGIERGMLLKGATMAAGMAVKHSSYSDYTDLAIKGAGLAANLVNQKYGRDAERESDHYGMIYMERAGYDPRAAISLQETFVRLSMSKNTNWLTGLFASHPPSLERVENNKKDAADLKQGGILGEERYQKAIARLVRTKPAYEAYEQGMDALEAKDYAKAEQLAQQAIAIEKDEGLFHVLLGDARKERGQTRMAAVSYDRAIQANPEFFSFFEKRGDLRRQMGNKSGHRADMKQAAKLFPTVNSYLALGRFAEEDGDKAGAIRYFRAAAKSGTTNGRLAAQSLVRLDLPENPSRYLKAHFVLDRSGHLMVSVQNPTQVAVRGIMVTVLFRDERGVIKSVPLQVSGAIEAGGSKLVVSGIGPVNGALLRQQGFQVRVDKAQI